MSCSLTFAFIADVFTEHGVLHALHRVVQTTVVGGTWFKYHVVGGMCVA